MTNNARPRHAAQSRASKIAGRTALGVLGAPVAMLAVAGPAGAATLDMGGTYEDGTLDLNLAADGMAAPGLDALGVPALPTELPSQLPVDGAAFEGVSLDLFDLGGQDDIALPGLPSLPSAPDAGDVALPALPSADSLPLAGALAGLPVALPDLPSADSLPSLPTLSDVALPGTDSLPSLPGTDSLPSLPGTDSLPSVPTAGDLALPELPALPGTDSLPSLPGTDSLPSLPSATDAVDTATGLAGGLPTSAQLDLDDVSSTVTDAAPAAADVFSATDLVQGLI